MSYETVSLIDPSLEWIERDVRGTKVGYSSFSRREIAPATTGYSAGDSVSWNLTMDQPLVGSAPLIACEATFVFGTMTGANNAAVVADSVNLPFGYNSFPINRLLSNVNVSMEGSSDVSTRPSRVLSSLAKSMPKDDLLAISPYSAPDIHHSYELTAVADVLSHPMDSAHGWTRHWRTAQVMSLVGNSIAHTLTIKVRLVERLCANPLQWAAGRHPMPFVGLNKMVIRAVLGSDLTQMLAVPPLGGGRTLDSVTINKMSLLLDQCTPHAKVSYPSKAFYPFFRTQDISANGGPVTIAAGASNQFTMPSTAFSVIPKLIVLRAFETGRTVARPERDVAITNVELTLNGSRRRFFSLNQHQLYLLSRKNGYQLSYQCFINSFDAHRATANGLQGSVMYIVPSDTGTTDFTQSNVMASTTIEAHVTVSNTSDANQNVQCELVVLEDMILQSNKGSWDSYPALVTKSDVSSSKTKLINESELNGDYIGGSFWSWIKGAVKSPFFKGAVKLLRNHIPGVKEIAGDSTMLGKLASSQGYGLVDTRGDGVVNLAGKKMSAAELSSMLS